MRETHLVTYITNKLIIKIRGINEIYTISHGSYKRDIYPPAHFSILEYRHILQDIVSSCRADSGNI